MFGWGKQTRNIVLDEYGNIIDDGVSVVKVKPKKQKRQNYDDGNGQAYNPYTGNMEYKPDRGAERSPTWMPDGNIIPGYGDDRGTDGSF